jgi:hypothetical protein
VSDSSTFETTACLIAVISATSHCALLGIDFETVPHDESFKVRVLDYARLNCGVSVQKSA